MVWYVGGVNLRNVSVYRVFGGIVVAVGFLSIQVPFRSVQAFAPCLLESLPYSADTGEQVYEGKIPRFLIVILCRNPAGNHVHKAIRNEAFRHNATIQPAVDCALVYLELCRNIGDRIKP